MCLPYGFAEDEKVQIYREGSKGPKRCFNVSFFLLLLNRCAQQDSLLLQASIWLRRPRFSKLDLVVEIHLGSDWWFLFVTVTLPRWRDVGESSWNQSTHSRGNSHPLIILTASPSANADVSRLCRVRGTAPRRCHQRLSQWVLTTSLINNSPVLYAGGLFIRYG